MRLNHWSLAWLTVTLGMIAVGVQALGLWAVKEHTTSPDPWHYVITALVLQAAVTLLLVGLFYVADPGQGD